MFDYEYWGNSTLSIKQNMALEEYLLARSESKNVATVRFWNVEKDAVVLGYGEDASNIKKLDSSFDVARRITGGSHVQFDSSCIAYSFTVPRDGSFRHFEDMRKYFAQSIYDALAELGVDDVRVDNRASTINVNGKVIASHAIFWGVKSALMHGLLLIDKYNVDKILERVALRERRIGNGTYAEYSALANAPNMISVLGKRLDSVDHAKRNAYAKKLAVDEILKQVTEGKFSGKLPSQGTLSDAEALTRARHASEPWFIERRPPYTEEEVESIPGEELSGALKKNQGYCLYIQVPDRDFAKMAQPSE